MTTVSGLTTSEIIDVINRNFSYDVQKFPLTGPDNMKTGYFGLFDQYGNVVGTKSVTDQYVVHTDDQIKKLAIAATEAFEGAARIRCFFNAGHNFIIEPPRSKRRNIFGTADSIFPRAIIRAPYITGAVVGSVGMWRDLCLNLSMMSQVESSTIRIHHDSFLDGNMDYMIKQFQKLHESWELVADAAEDMESRSVILSDFLREVYTPPTIEEIREKPGKQEKYESLITRVFNRVLDERERSGRSNVSSGNNVQVSAWEAYNAVQGHQQHGTKRKKVQGVGEDTMRIFKALNDKYVDKARELALSA